MRHNVYNILWFWWQNACLDYRKDLIVQLNSGNWLKSLPVEEQVALFKNSPPEVKQTLDKWNIVYPEAIHPETLQKLGLRPNVKRMIPLPYRK